MRYFFVLGNHPELSKAEIHALLNARGISFSLEISSDRILILDAQDNIDMEELQKSLGGVTKTGELIEKLDVRGGSRAEAIGEYLETLNVDDLIARTAGKRTTFGFSVYALAGKNVPFRTAKKLQRFGIALKKRLVESRGNARFVTSKHHDLSAVVIGENALLVNGADICFFLDEKSVYVGLTRAVQPYKEYSERDYGRPARAPRSGMLPPKLAQMMVNLAGVPKTSTVLDPFCGSGTVLQEALLLGYQEVVGSDISEDAVHDTEENLEWLKGLYEIKGTFSVTQANVLDLTKSMKPRSVNAIVTEPYLGPPLSGVEAPENIKKNADALSALYSKAVRVFRTLLSPGGRLVMVVPEFLLRGEEHPVRVQWDGFRDIAFPDWVDRTQFVYARKDQHVRRRINVKEKV